jgi:glycosidase
VAENWTETRNIAPYFGDTRTVAGGDEMPSNFNFPLADEILKGVNRADAAGIAAKLNEVAQVYPAGILDAPFLTNHDQVRLSTQLGKSPSRLRNAAAILLTLQGAPFVYYGEEVGLENGTTNNDEAKRTPMPWDASPGGGFTAGTPWFAFAPGQSSVNVAAQTADGSSLFRAIAPLACAASEAPAAETSRR